VSDNDLVKSAAFDVLLTDAYALRSTLRYSDVKGNIDILSQVILTSAALKLWL